MYELLATQYVTTLSGNGGSITSGATSFNVAAALPSGVTAPFKAVIYAPGATTGEIVLVGAVSTLAWSSVTRAQETTLGAPAAASHNDGDFVAIVLTGLAINDMLNNRVVKIAESIAGGAVASVTFSSIPGTYRNLFIDYQARGDVAATNAQLYVQFNADTGSNYDSELADVAIASWAGAENVAQAQMALAIVCGSTAPASVAGAGRIVIPNYAATVFQKNALCHGGFKLANTTTNIQTGVAAGFWRSTAAITSVLLKPSSGNFIAGSNFQLYGEM